MGQLPTDNHAPIECLVVKEFIKEVLSARTGKDAIDIYRNKPEIYLIQMDIRPKDDRGNCPFRSLFSVLPPIEKKGRGIVSDARRVDKISCNSIRF